MGDVREPRSGKGAVTAGEPDALDQDTLYSQVAAEFGPSLARLAAAYEFEPTRQQDLLQELHFALWRSLAVFRHQCSLRTWVYRVAHNTATTYARQQRRTRRLSLVSLEDLDEPVDETDVDRLVDDAVVRKRLMDLIAQLKPIDRDVLLLYLEGLTAIEISKVVGISPTNAAQKTHRAQKYLKRRLRSGETHDHSR